MSDDTRFYAVVVVVEATSYEEAHKLAAEKCDGVAHVSEPWPVETGHGQEPVFDDTIRLIDQHPEADF